MTSTRALPVTSMMPRYFATQYQLKLDRRWPRESCFTILASWRMHGVVWHITSSIETFGTFDQSCAFETGRRHQSILLCVLLIQICPFRYHLFIFDPGTPVLISFTFMCSSRNLTNFSDESANKRERKSPFRGAAIDRGGFFDSLCIAPFLCNSTWAFASRPGALPTLEVSPPVSKVAVSRNRGKMAGAHGW